MTTGHEDDVVIAFRQAVEEELRRAQQSSHHEPVLQPDASTEENLQRLSQRHEELQHEVALLRTIILKLVSQPIDPPFPPES